MKFLSMEQIWKAPKFSYTETLNFQSEPFKKYDVNLSLLKEKWKVVLIQRKMKKRERTLNIK